MAEPHSTTAAGILLGTGIGLTGTIMGAQVDALLLGMFAAILVSIWLPSINDRWRAASAVGLSSLFAGYGSPVATAWLAAEQSGLRADSPLRLLVALAIGAGGPTLVPVLIDRAKRMISGG